jgi:3-oxoacyl-[acyl-carrier protein] reductase
MPRDEFSLRGETALVTGAGAGIGAAIAEALAQLGAAVAVHYNSNTRGAEATRMRVVQLGSRSVCVQGDLRRPDEVTRVVAEAEGLGQIGILVNNAGDLVARSEIAEASDELYEHVMDLNMRSVFLVTRAVLPGMIERRRGSVINVTSIAARTGGVDGATIYAAAKGAVSSFTRGLAKEVAPHGIRVNAISPGVIDTAFHERHSGGPGEMAARAALVPLGRVGTPRDCAGTAQYLALPELSGYITGQVIEVNGGQLTP